MKEEFTSINSFALFVKVSTRTIQRRIDQFNQNNKTDHKKGVHDSIVDLDLQEHLKKEFMKKEKEPIQQPVQENKNVFEFEVKNKPEEVLISEAEKEMNLIIDQKDFEIETLKKTYNELFEEYKKSNLKFDSVEKENELLLQFNKEKSILISESEKDIQQLNVNLKDMHKGIDLLQIENQRLLLKIGSRLQQRLSSDWLIVVVLLVILCADMIAFSIIGHNSFKEVLPSANIIFAVIGLATGIGSVVTYNRIKEVKLAEIWKWIFGVLQFCVFSFAINEQWFYAETIMTIMFVLVFIGVQRSIKK